MVTVDLSGASSLGHQSNRGTRQPYIVEYFVTGAQAAAAKGSALATADILQIADIPAESLVLSAGIELDVSDSGSDITMNLGIGAATDVFVDGADATAAAGYMATGTNGEEIISATRVTAADTLDLAIIQAVSLDSNDDWEIRVYMILMDISGQPEAAPAQALNS